MILFTATQKRLYKTHKISQPHTEEHRTAVPQKIPTSIFLHGSVWRGSKILWFSTKGRVTSKNYKIT